MWVCAPTRSGVRRHTRRAIPPSSWMRWIRNREQGRNVESRGPRTAVADSAQLCYYPVMTLRTALKLVGSVAIALVSTITGFGQGNSAELKVGDIAPQFNLPGSDGRTHRLADYKGKSAVVLAWFPKAFTGG